VDGGRQCGGLASEKTGVKVEPFKPAPAEQRERVLLQAAELELR
jgi:hypothetical protein